MKLYIFKDDNGNTIEQVRAENHDQALKVVQNESITFLTDFFSVEDEEDN